MWIDQATVDFGLDRFSLFWSQSMSGEFKTRFVKGYDVGMVPKLKLTGNDDDSKVE